MKLAYCILVCTIFKVVHCTQKQDNIVDDDSYFDILKAQSGYSGTEKNYLRILALVERNIIQCLYCNFMLLNKYTIGRSYFAKDRQIQCSYFSSETCLGYFENYLNVNNGEKGNKNKRHFDEIDKTDAQFSTLNQIH